MSEPDIERDASVESETPIPADNAAHLLIIDDDRRIRVLLQRYLSQEGYRITLAGNAEEADAALKNFSFDLIVLDVMMPGENGLEFAARLRADASELRPRADSDADRPDGGGGPDAPVSSPGSTTISASPMSRASFRCASPPSCGARSRARRRGR